MDWKMTPWDLEDFEQNAEPIIGGSGVSQNGGLIGHHRDRIDCSVDLKLGGLGDFGSSEKWREQSMISITTSSSSGSSKRARSSGNCTQNAACLVEGCKSDLSNSREYHRRHKVCEIHSKTPIVIVGGQEQRFCQQCSRFHLLVEFDEVKRSCRKRLDGHNRRRRKPQPESIDSGSLFLGHQGSTTSRYSSYPEIFPSATSEPTWENIIKTGEDSIYNAHQRPSHFIDTQPPHFPTSSIGYRDRKQFPFSQDGNGFRVFANDLSQVLGSDCVLSLLSSPTQAPGVNVGQLAPADRIPVGQPLVSSFSYGGLGRWSPQLQAPDNVSATGFSCSAIEEDADIQCEGMMFRVGDEGSSDGASMQVLPFFQQ